MAWKRCMSFRREHSTSSGSRRSHGASGWPWRVGRPCWPPGLLPYDVDLERVTRRAGQDITIAIARLEPALRRPHAIEAQLLQAAIRMSCDGTRRQIMRTRTQVVAQGEARAVLDAEAHLQRLRPPEQLHRDELWVAVWSTHDGNADLGGSRLQQIG